MKGKTVLSFFSLVLCVASVVIYVTRQSSSVVVRADADAPKITLVGYEFYRFKDDLVVSRLAGEKAVLFDGGRVEMTAGLRAVRLTGQRREELSAKRADVQLASSSAGSLNTMDHVSKIRVREDVDLMVGEVRLETEDATYTDDDATIRSLVPVRMEQTGQYLAGEQGFEFNMKLESVKMKGGVTGTILPAVIRKSPPKGVKK